MLFYAVFILISMRFWGIHTPLIRPPPSCADSKMSDVDVVLGRKNSLLWELLFL